MRILGIVVETKIYVVEAQCEKLDDNAGAAAIEKAFHKGEGDRVEDGERVGLTGHSRSTTMISTIYQPVGDAP